MKHVVEFSDEIEQALEQRASATGDDVVHLIQLAVVSFVGTDRRAAVAGRRPDPPLAAVEAVAPCDLPRTGPRLIPIERASQRRLDPLAESA